MNPFDWRNPSVSIPARLAQLAREAPNADAVRDHDRTLSRGDLERATNGVANTIVSERRAGNDIVGILAGINSRAIVAALGVLKAGRAYAGLQDTFAPAQLAELLDDAEAELVLTDLEHADLARHIAGPARRVLVIDDIAPDDRAPDLDIDVDTLAMLNYTSGSTGKSKGVMHTHRTVLENAGRSQAQVTPQPDDCHVIFHTSPWVGFSWNLIGPLSSGMSVAPFDIRVHGPNALARRLRDDRVTIADTVVVLRQLWLAHPTSEFPLVRHVQMGGQAIFRRDMEAARRAFPSATLTCRLGITEAGLVCEFVIRPDDPIEHDVTPIGFPAEGVRVWLLDDSGEPVTPGEAGEIVAQSDYLARGYWRQPDLTAERFRIVPRLGDTPAYFSGDLGRQLPSGAMLHVGRKDFVVKVHGMKAPLTEIEGQLLSLEGVAEACVVANPLPDGDNQLVAYVVASPSRALSIGELQARLAERLPDYMLPRRFVFLDELPKTHTGKIDRRALPSLTNARPTLDHPPIAPRSPTEREVVAIWEAVLGVAGIGVEDRFLELGGDSLQAMQIVSRVTKAFRSDLSVRDLFGAPTVSEMAQLVCVFNAAND